MAKACPECEGKKDEGKGFCIHEKTMMVVGTGIILASVALALLILVSG